MICRGCGAEAQHCLADLGSTPAANAYLSDDDLNREETWFPLRVIVCDRCHLVQTEYSIDAEQVFADDYAYLSSTSQSWLRHARDLAAEMVGALDLGRHSFVVEVASNDGYLLRNFVGRHIPCLGIEPSRVAADVARSQGIATLNEFLSPEVAQQIVADHKPADLVIANNVLAHVPFPHQFLKDLRTLVSSRGLIVCEFAYLVDLIRDWQFDTMYHEHYSYLSLRAVEEMGKALGLTVIDARRLGSHGGSLRVTFAVSGGERAATSTRSVDDIRQLERSLHISTESTRHEFQKQVQSQCNDLRLFLTEQYVAGRQVAAYGAAAKGNTRLNVAGIRYPLLSFVAERSPTKVGRYLPGSRIPIVDESRLNELRPDFLLLLPWNLSRELITQLEYVRSWGARFVIPAPHLTII